MIGKQNINTSTAVGMEKVTETKENELLRKQKEQRILDETRESEAPVSIADDLRDRKDRSANAIDPPIPRDESGNPILPTFGNVRDATTGRAIAEASQETVDALYKLGQTTQEPENGVLNPEGPRALTKEEVKLETNDLIAEGMLSRNVTIPGELKGIGDNFELFARKSQNSQDDPKEFAQNFVKALEGSNRGVDNLFGQLSNKVVPDETNLKSMGVESFLQKKANTVDYALRSVNKLNVSANPDQPNAPIRGVFPAVFALATFQEVLASYDDQTSEQENPSDRRFSNAMDRAQLGHKVSRAAEMMMYPTLNSSGEPFFGEVQDIGYKSRLTDDEHDAVGQYFLQAFADSDAFPWFESNVIKNEDTGRTKIVFNTTRLGDLNLTKVRLGLKEALNLDKKTRPVRTMLTPFRGGSSSITESNYFLRRMTKGLSGVSPVKAMDYVVNLLNNVKHTVDPKSLLIGMSIVNSTSPILTKYMKQNPEYLEKKRSEFLEDFEGRAVEEGLTVEQLSIFDKSIGGIVTSKEAGGGGFERAAEIKAEAVLLNHRTIKEELTKDGLNRLGKTIFLDNMPMSGSGRIMVQNDELNPTLHKFARALLKASKPTLIKKSHNKWSLDALKKAAANEEDYTSLTPIAVIDSAIRKANTGFKTAERIAKGMEYTSEEKFMVLLARTLVPHGDKFAKNGYGPLLTEFKSRYVELSKLGQPLLEAMKQVGSIMNDPANLMNNMEANKGQTGVPGLPVSPELEKYIEDQGKDEFYFALNNLVELAKYNDAIEGQTISTRTTAEADGVSNGATIQGFQMGVKDILVRGGVLFQGDGEISGDLRDFVFDHIELLPQIHTENSEWAVWQDVFRQLRIAGKGKDLLKVPIMTSIFGLEPRFQTGSARKFISENRRFFDGFEDSTNEDIVKSLTIFLKEGLENTLGGALEHAKTMKRVGRLFNFAHQIGEIRGPELIPGDDSSRFIGKMGGRKSEVVSQEVYNIPDRNYINPATGFPEGFRPVVISTNKTVNDPLGKADSKKIEPGIYTDPKDGSKVMNSMAVNTTHMIDSAILTRAAIRFLSKSPDNFMMQMYDGIISDVEGFIELSEIINEEFSAVNRSYNLLKEEKKAIDDLIASIEVRMNKNPEEIIDLSIVGEFPMLGKFLGEKNIRTAIINVDVPGPDLDSKSAVIKGNKEMQDRYKKLSDNKTAVYNAVAKTAAEANALASFSNGKRKLKASDFLIIFKKVIADLQIQQAHARLMAEVAERKKELGVMIKANNYI